MSQALFEIVAERGPDAGRRYPLTKAKTVIGREPTCEIPLQDEFASRRHAEIAVEREGHVLLSTSPIGFSVNGKPSERVVLQNGDQIDMGPYTRLRYQRVESKASAQVDAPTRVYTGPPIPPPGATTAVPRAAAAAAAAAGKAGEGAGRRRKMFVGVGVYGVLLVVMFLLLSGLKGRGGLPEPIGLTILQIEEDLKAVEVPLPANDDEANRWRQEALFLDKGSYSADNLYRIYSLIRAVARHEKQEPGGAAEQAMNRALRELVRLLYDQHRRAYVADKAGQFNEAIAHYRKVRRMVPNHRLKIYQICVERERMLAGRDR